MRFFLARVIVFLLAAFVGWQSAEAQTAVFDCSTGHHWFDSFDGDLGTAAVTQADACAAAAAAMGLADASKATPVPGGCLMDEAQWGYGVFLNATVDYCAPAPVAGGGGGSVDLVLPTPSADDYTAATTIFGAILTALCIVGGMVAVVRVFNRSPDA